MAISLALAGCAALGQAEYDYPAQAVEARREVADWPSPAAAQTATTLVELIPSDTLEALVEEALSANPGLQQTLLTLKMRLAEVVETSASRLSAGQAEFTTTRDEADGVGYRAGVTVAWEADPWRKLADAESAAGKDAEQQHALYVAARDTLVAETMSAWLALIAQRRSIAIEAARVTSLAENEALIVQRYRAGLGTLEELDTARSNTASARATLSQREEALAQQQRSLGGLLGRSADADIELPEAFPETLIALPSLPEQTLARRPDLQAAYAALEAAGLRRGIAYKEMLPSLNLTAALEDAASRPRALLLSDPLWSLLGQLTQPLFQGGGLKAAAHIAELQEAQAYQAYREVLLEAVSDVEDAIGLEASLASRQAHTEAALASARRSHEHYQSRYRLGLVTLLDLLSIQQQTYDLESQLNDLIHERLANRVALGLALGLGASA
nr:TolC family protein [Halomonas socia]